LTLDDETTTATSARRPASLWGARRNGITLFAPSVDARRVRRVTDVLLAVVAALATWGVGVVALPPSGLEQAVEGLVEEIPSFLDIVWRLACGTLVLWLVWLIVATLWRRRFGVAADLIASLVLTTTLGTLLARRMNGEWPSVSQIVTGGSDGLVPAVGLAAAVAVSTAIAPQLTRPCRRAGWLIVLAATLSMVLLGATSPSGALLALSVGVLGAALVHLVLGTQAGHVGDDEVIESLGELGVAVDRLAARPARGGLSTYDAVAHGTGPVSIRVYGRDARDTQVLVTLWRSAINRGADSPSLTRLQQVEHEGFVTLLAARHGVGVPSVVAAGCTSSGDALIVLSGCGEAIEVPPPADTGGPQDTSGPDDTGADGLGNGAAGAAAPPVEAPTVAPDAVADGELAQMWRLIGDLHAAGLAAGALEVSSFSRDAEGSVRFHDLRNATVAPSDDRRRSDLAQVLVVTAVLHGPDRAVVAAGAALGADGLALVLPYLQPAAVSRGLRKALGGATGSTVDQLRVLAAAVAGVEAPPLARLRRVSSATLMRVGLLSLIAFALITTLGGVSISELRDELGGANWGWVIAAVVVGQLPFFTQAVAARGACPRPIAYGPLAVLQFAIGFINLAIPSSAARIALDVRFFQRQGVPPAAAVSIAAIDGFSGFLVQIALLVATLVFGLGQVELTFSPPSSSGGGSNLSWVIVAGVVLVVVAVIAVFAVRRLRERVVARVRPMLAQVRDTVRSLRSPVKLAQLFGGSLANQLLFALTLGACLHAFGGRLNLATLLVVYVGAALFGGMMPVPGGIGVMEAALIALMTAGGVTSPIATAAAVTFRLVTFYLPPVWGWVAFNWLQRHEYL
jgi:uncharacterized protein (TIRG00374 family)